MSSNKEFMGISIKKRGPSSPRIKKALDKSAKLLNIMEFIKVTKFKLNKVLLIGNHSHHLGAKAFEWFGYEEGDYKTQKQKFVDMLKRNDIDFEELTWEDKNITLYPTIQEEMSTMAQCDVVKSKFLVMKPDDIKCAMTNLETKKGDSIRRYYVRLEHLFKLYVEYTMYYNHQESQRKITSREDGISLEEVKDQNNTLIDETKSIQRKLGIPVEDRVPRPEDVKERFVGIARWMRKSLWKFWSLFLPINEKKYDV